MRRSALAIWLGLAAALAGAAAPASAQDAPPPGAAAKAPKASEAASAAIDAHKAGDTKTLASIAKRATPDVWAIVDHLLDRGERAAALALAKAAPGPDTEKLPAYVEAWKPSPDDAQRRAAMKRVSELESAKKDAEILALLAGVPPGPEDILRVRIHQARAMSLARSAKLADALAAYEAACGAAERIGWIARAASMRFSAGTTALKARDPKSARPHLERAAALHERRGDVRGRARALVNLSSALQMDFDWEGARPVAEESLVLAERGGEEDTVMRALAGLASVIEDLARARALTERATAIALRLNAREVLGNLHFNLGIQTAYLEGQAAALPHYEEALTVRRGLGDRHSIANTLRFLGEARSDLGEHETASALFDEARALGTAVDAQEELGYLELAVGRSWHARGDHVKATEHYRRAEAHAARSGAPILAVRVRFQLAKADLDRGEAARARDGFLEASREFRKWKLAGEETDALTNLALSLCALGDFRAALPHAQEALRLAERDGAKPNMANALVALGRIQSELGDHARALDTLQRALDWAAKAENRAFEAAVLLKVNAVHESRRDVAQALRCSERARELAEAVWAKGSLANAHRRIGLLYYRVCDYERAQAAHEKALTLFEAAGRSEETGWSLVSLANVLMDRGAYARAQACLERAIALFEKTGDAADLATALGNLEIVREVIGETGNAIEAQRRVVRLHESAGSGRSLAAALGNLANDLVAAGEIDEALALETRALELRRKDDDRDGLAYSAMGLGRIHEARGEWDQALARFDEARALWEGLGNVSGVCNAANAVARVWQRRGDHGRALGIWTEVLDGATRIGEPWRQQSALASMAECLRELGRPGEAISAAKRSLEAGRTVVAGFSDEHAAGARAALLPAVAAGFRAAQKLDDPAEALHFLEVAKAGAFLEGVGSRAALRETVLSRELREAERAAASREAAAAWSVGRAKESGDAKLHEAAVAALASARDERAAVIGKIQREAKLAAGVVEPRISTLAAVQAALRPGEAFVHFALLDAHAVALVVEPKAARIVALGDAEAVRASAASLRADDGAADPAAAIAKLRAALVEPLGLGVESKRLLIAPDDVLTFTPFCALVGDRDVVYLPSATTWALLRESAAAKGTGVLALGDPEYGARTAVAAPVAVLRSAERLLPLPGTREEAKSVGTKVLLGADATEANLRAALASQRWRAVHLACHGLIDTVRPAQSSLALTPTAEDDGFLTALDVFGLRVPADLVVLSACRTGGGKVVRGEGVLGLTRAFMFAGAPRVLVSLWKVDDAATAALMKRFYARWNEGVPAAQALRDAQAHVASQPAWKHPRFWAAWTLWGLPD